MTSAPARTFDPPVPQEAFETLDTKIGQLARSLYERTSKALHGGTQQ
jgi:hypothetical protein